MSQCTKTEGWQQGKLNQLETLRKKMEQKQALYNLNPKPCKQCNKALSYKDSQKGKAFCNHSCAATFNNNQKQIAPQKICPVCSQNFKQRQNKFCSQKCSAQHVHIKQMEINVKKFFNGEFTDKSRAQIRRVLLHLGVAYKCDICNLTDWMDKPLSLTLDHIDGRANNNDVSNLRFLCPNCDSQTKFYKSKNKGYGRKSLGLL